MSPLTRLTIVPLLGSALLAIGTAAASPRVADPRPLLEIDGQGTTVSARIVAMPLRIVMDEFARTTSAEVSWLDPPGDEAVSATFRHLRPIAAARRLLAGRNHLIVPGTSADRSPALHIWVGSPTAPIASPSEVADATASPRSAADLAAAARLEALAEDEPDTLEHLEDVLFGPSDPRARVRAMRQLAARPPDPRVRGLAARALGGSRAPAVRREALRLLVRLGAPPVDQLASIALRDGSRGLRRAALLAVVEHGARGTAEYVLSQLVSDEESGLRGLARRKLVALRRSSERSTD